MSKTYKNKILNILPGLAVCVIIAIIGSIIGKFIPSLGAATFCIIIGMIVGNTFCNKKFYAAGAKFSESDLLAYSIVLMGGTLKIEEVFSIGGNGILFIVIQMAITIVCACYIGRFLKFSRDFSYLMAAGNAVCGSSAIAATAPAIKAKEEDVGISITMVNLTGTVLMFILPALAEKLYGGATLQSSAMLGGVLQSVGQVIGAATFMTPEVVELSAIFKIVRIIFIVFVVLILGELSVRHKNEKAEKIHKEKRKRKSKLSIPWFIIGFFILCLINSMGVIPKEVSNLFHTISGKFEIIALAGIGMRVKFSELIKQGPKASIFALSIAIVQVISVVVLINILL